ncbi:MAG TPA: hypothetical protein VFO29_09605 [Candidatus Rubrimentiphilum sp.]|nr:hypothetical protein [Candidatus Rubrimentiphilum sp.]
MAMTAAVPDIIAESPDLALGRGWYPVESFAGTRFRWASNDAELLVVALQPVRHALVLTLEPGPGVGLKPFTLQVMESGKEIARADVRGKQPIRIELPPAGPKIYRLIFHVEGGGRTIANDARILNFRVFEAAVQRADRDVLPADMELGTGWHPIEKHGDASFRWVSNDAKVTISNPDGTKHLDLDLQSGPGLENKPFVLHVLQKTGNDTKLVTDVQVTDRQRVDVPIPKGERVELILRVDSKGHKTPGDPRELNFRVFQYAGTA